jgi:hypothetical protein
MMGGDPNMGGEHNMSGDPNMGGDPMMGGDPNMDDSTMSIINQLSPEDREAVRSYAESMLDNSGNGGEDTPPTSEPPMMESVIFTKKQLKTIMENVGIFNEPKKQKVLKQKNTKSVSNKSPFNSPNFRKL